MARYPACAVFLALWIATPGDAAGTELESPTSLHDVLVRDARSSPAACPAVVFETDESQPSPEALRMPPNPSGPTPVELSLFVIAVDDVETQTNSFRLEAFATMVWCDPRLRFDPDAAGVPHRMYEMETAVRHLETIWWPGLFLPTRLGPPLRTGERLLIYPDGTVRTSLKTNIRMTARFDFSRFPLDHHVLRIPVQSALHSEQELQLITEPARNGFDPGFDMPEWHLLGTTTRIERVASPGNAPDYSRFVMEIRIARKFGFYGWKIGLPVLLILGVSWSVFWMSRDALAQRQRQAATGILTLVAYQFVATATLPRVSYLTLLDAVFLWSLIAAASALVLNVQNHRRFRQEPGHGVKADRRWRWLSVLLYVGGVAAIVVWHLAV